MSDQYDGPAMAQQILRLQAEVTKLRADAGWQPIETAPKMRKVIVHYVNELGKSRCVMACYYLPNSLEMHDDYQDCGTYNEEDGVAYADEGWYEEHDSENPVLPLGGNPTHWMPLPKPPSDAALGAT